MQSQNLLNRIVQSSPVNLEDADDLAGKMKAAQEQGAVSHTVGKLPRSGETLIINGLQYTVSFADFVKGKFTVKAVMK